MDVIAGMGPSRGIALVGFMGAGKTEVGRRVAERLGWSHVDLDELLVRAHGPIDVQFARDGEPTFRAREREAVRSVTGQVVLSVGGGTPVDAVARGLLESRFRTVHLEVDLDTARARIGAGTGRPVWADAEDRWRARQDVYRAARATVDARGTPDQVADAVLAAVGPRVVSVGHGRGTYDVVIAPTFAGLSERLRHAGELRVVTDTNVGPAWGHALAAEIGRAPDVVVPAGESSKTLQIWADVMDCLLTSDVRRDTSIVALGGGVIGDLAGFAASALVRGVPLVQVPTSLLAMVDSSVGGKTGVNHPRGKNLIGAFHAPSLVWISLATLGTLPVRERLAGLGEVLKTAVVLDALLFDVLEAHADGLRAGDAGLTEHVVAACVRAKARVVAEDEHERGVRRLLNAGHTVGHAIERAARYGSVLHGEAVAIGLVHEARWAAREGLCDPGLPDRIARVAGALGLPVRAPAGLDPATLADAVAVDKKSTRDILWLPVPVRAGHGTCVALPRARADELILDVFDRSADGTADRNPASEPG